MYENNNYLQSDPVWERSEAASGKMMSKVFGWMTGALAITAVTAMFVSSSPNILSAIFGSKGLFLGLIIGEFALVIALSAAINRLSALSATLLFLLYSVLNGVTLSSIFLVYKLGSIATAFVAAAATFAVMAIYGAITKKDLTKLGNLCIMAVIGLVIAMLINMFIGNSVMDMIISGIGILVFVGLTAYDTQKIKALLYGAEENDTTQKIAVLGALTLYLDFINIFLYLLRFLGRRD